MKKISTLILLLFVLLLHAQNDITGTWIQSTIFHPQSREGFELYYRGPNVKSGPFITFQDGKFATGYDRTSICGNDLRAYTYGTYTIEDDNYITITTDSIRYSGRGSKPHIGFDPAYESLTYYTYKTSNGYRFVKSKGNLATDKLLAADFDYLEKFLTTHTEIGLKRQAWKRVNAKTDNEIFAKGLALVSEYDPAKAELIFIEDFDDNFYRLFLFEYEGERHILLYVDHHLGVCLYDDSHNVVRFY